MKHSKYHLLNILSEQSNILVIFVILMMVPTIILCCTEPYSPTTIISSLTLSAAFYALWGIASSRLGVMILASLPLMILGAFQLVLIYLFGGSIIAVDMFTNLFTTNASEAGELLGNIYPAIVGVCILYISVIALGIHSIRLKKSLTTINRLKMLVFVLIIGVSGVVATLYSQDRYPDSSLKQTLFPLNVINNAAITIDRWEQSNKFLETSKDFSFGATKHADSTRREVYILVVGEASRAMNWQLFGYDRATNPKLAATDGIVLFPDMLTQVNATHKTVPIILSPCSAEDYDQINNRKSIITLFKEAGFRTLFISNQVSNRSLIDYFSQEAEQRIDIVPGNGSLITESRFDGEMLPHIDSAIRNTNDNLFIVLHTYGSHFSFEKRYPREFATFQPDITSSVTAENRQSVINAYDNSIIYTDHLLSEIIGLLRADSTTCSAMLYCSDHGEDIMDDNRNRFLHASPTPTYYQLHIASLAWLSPAYKNQFAKQYENLVSNHTRPSSTASVFHTIAQIGDINSEYVDSTRSLASPNYTEHPRKYLTDHNKSVDFFNSGLAPQDFVMLHRMNVKYDSSKVVKIIY